MLHAAINSNHLDRDFPVVAVDDQPAAERIVELLIRHGHRRVGFVQGRCDVRVAVDRQAGYRAAMERAGLAVDPAWIAEGDFSFDAGLKAGVALLSQPRRVSAVFAANDNMAMGIVHAAHAMGLTVPKDVSVVGFDDAEGVDPAVAAADDDAPAAGQDGRGRRRSASRPDVPGAARHPGAAGAADLRVRAGPAGLGGRPAGRAALKRPPKLRAGYSRAPLRRRRKAIPPSPRPSSSALAGSGTALMTLRLSSASIWALIVEP